jgi:hypothetical protein
VVLKGHFYISTQELCNAVIEAKKETKRKGCTKGKKKANAILYKSESEEHIKEEARDESKSEAENCIIVDVK